MSNNAIPATRGSPSNAARTAAGAVVNLGGSNSPIHANAMVEPRAAVEAMGSTADPDEIRKLKAELADASARRAAKAEAAATRQIGQDLDPGKLEWSTDAASNIGQGRVCGRLQGAVLVSERGLERAGCRQAVPGLDTARCEGTEADHAGS